MQIFKWSNRNKVGEKWFVFYYTMGTGFDTGIRVYYGKNEWTTEESAIQSQAEWEKNK